MSSPAVDAALRAHLQAVSDLLIRERGPRVDMRESDRDRWARGSDHVFRPEKPREPSVFPEWYEYEDRSHRLPTFGLLVEAVRADPVLSPQFEASVGAGGSAQRLDFDRLVRRMLRALIDTDRGELEFREDRFQSHWQALAPDLYADTLNSFTVVLLPGLTVPGAFPVELAPNLQITELSDAEVTRAVSCGFFLSPFSRLIRDTEARAIRHTSRLPKEINAEPDLSPDEGAFGQRPPLMFHLLADDILSALRLVKAGRLRSPGVMRYVDSWLLEGFIGFHHRGVPPFGGQLAPIRNN